MREGKDGGMRGTAAQALLDRGWGKKAKLEVVTGAEGSYFDVLGRQTRARFPSTMKRKFEV